MHGPVPSPDKKGGKMSEISFDHAKLKGLAREKGETVESLSRVLGIAMKTFSLKWNGKRSFTDVEIYGLMKHLNIEDPEPYFFALRV